MSDIEGMSDVAIGLTHEQALTLISLLTSIRHPTVMYRVDDRLGMAEEALARMTLSASQALQLLDEAEQVIPSKEFDNAVGEAMR